MTYIGAKIRMNGERQRYTVTACNDRFAIMTKPFNAKKTYLYTITGLHRDVRGPCNFIFGLPSDVNSPDLAKEAFEMLEAGSMEVGYRRCIPLHSAERAQLMEINL